MVVLAPSTVIFSKIGCQRIGEALPTTRLPATDRATVSCTQDLATNTTKHIKLHRLYNPFTMSEIDPDTGLTVSNRSPRFTMWAAFLIFSTITMGAAVEEVSLRIFLMPWTRCQRVDSTCTSGTRTKAEPKNENRG